MFNSLCQQYSRDLSILNASSGSPGSGNLPPNSGPPSGNNQPQGGSGSGKVFQEKKDKDGNYPLQNYIDHTFLKATTTTSDVKKICDEAKKYNFAAVCIPPSFITDAKILLRGSKVKIATVIGFPLGYSTTETKVFETEKAIMDGADEIDMVINIGFLKEGRYVELKNEISSIKKSCKNKTLKVIVETCYLTEDEIRMVTQIVD